MNIEQVLEVLKKHNISHYLTEMSQVHMYTKHYLLIAEELSEEGVAFLQPLKEHRDAYDHLSRIFALSLKDDNTGCDEEGYILDNVKKAFGHEYRAFFDMADWFTYICRKYIREELSNKIKRKNIKRNMTLKIPRSLSINYPFTLLSLEKVRMLAKNSQYLMRF